MQYFVCMKLKLFISFCIGCSFFNYLNSAENVLVSNISQLTFEGNRSGEGYFSSSGIKLCYQAEAFAGNPFYQIYLLDLENGSNELVSSGIGKTTCSWFHPNSRTILYASTHHDKSSALKQKKELDFRANNTKKKYSWDYDRSYELYTKDLITGEETRITNSDGYDAECAFSPDGKKIIFTSNRHFYDEDDPKSESNLSVYNELYLLDYKTRKIERLTTHHGYDGGPFFDSTGEYICWRRFSPDGHNAEIFSMSMKTRKEKKLTDLGAMSWAPFFHPSGKYIIFSTNIHGFQNFELYIVDTDGKKEPVRATNRDGFDSLPCFSPDGNTLSWTSNATPTKKSQIFLADWNHQNALKQLEKSPALIQEGQNPKNSDSNEPDTGSAILDHIEYLSSEDLGGRYTGSDGIKKANTYVANFFEKNALVEFDKKSFFQSFSFFKSASISNKSYLKKENSESKLRLGEEWTPLAFSDSGKSDIDKVVFAGYGLRILDNENSEEYDSYTHLDVKNKWILCLRKLPKEWIQEKKDKYFYHSTLRKKASVARDLGAKGIIFVSDDNTSSNGLIAFDQSTREKISVQAISLNREIVSEIFKENKKSFERESALLAKGNVQLGYKLEFFNMSCNIVITRNKGICNNTIGFIDSNQNKKLDYPYILVGAHIDHVGFGESSSRAKKKDKGKVHPGADDNGSGIGALLEIIRILRADPDLLNKLGFDVAFATWSGEEIGLVGSSFFAKKLFEDNSGLKRPLVAYLNMDMIGRLKDKMTIHGVGSSNQWRNIIQKANVPVRLSLNLQNDSHIPTDTTSFYSKGIPILSAFTGLHDDYHSPTDTADKLNYEGIEKCAKLFSRIITSIPSPGLIQYASQKAPVTTNRAKLRAYLGTIPNYSQTDQKGVLLSGVAQNGPADSAGLQSGDIVVELLNLTIENIYDYTEAIGKLKAGKNTKIKIIRNGKIVELSIVPKSR